MTTAFELGCLSAMEKVAAEPNTASNYGNALQAAQKKINIIGNNPDTKMYDAPYWNSFGAKAHNNLVGGLASIGDAAIGTGNFIGNRFNEAGSFLNDSIFGSVEQQRAAQTAAQTLKDQNLMLARHKKDYGQAGQGRFAPAGGKYQSFAGLNPDDEAAALAAIAPQPDSPVLPKNHAEFAQNPLIKNPYVLGGLGAAGLGLGGYAAYRAYQNSKKKKRPM